MAAIKLTAPQYKLLGAVVDTMKASFDWKAIATKMGHADAKKARDAWYGVRDKLTATVGADEKKSIDLAPAQKELLGFVIDDMSASIDWWTVAHKVGYPTAKKARDSWYPIRKKLMGSVGEGEKASPKKRKAAAEPDSEKSGNEAAPAKKSKRAAAKKTTDEDGSDEIPPAKKPKKTAPKKAPAAAKKGKKAETPDADGERAEEEIIYDRSDAADAGSEQEDREMFT
ncbi:hypothetical protein LTR91_024969 [Friedmanniomyces endolithicus]|uniref:Myb-like domain-containing protein n=1 Tax=Friedmanniomyces endolithicus TaxID=329885 RepID=A0AAN6H0S6_9PEZI|nr:hypothetical protein LTR94_012149 [Friedmanniomyces endolithicus]KAK0789426.1 hypothetical protein LTR38_010908 [Friedmanniomyces endolithicus]KAK0804280.1 hypothetical protein LTR59_004409 [Friedmanniomyces endolithicus]KAK0837364.1 hypothetical protein LTS02_017979 [Friedmanniomyces endolithicus]KAK0837785.1 hypothetical protein LTR03_012521 [Friedmanniomyces endolithicus]